MNEWLRWVVTELTLLRDSPGGAVSSFCRESLSPRTKSGGVRGFVLKKFIPVVYVVERGCGGGCRERKEKMTSLVRSQRE